MIEFLISLDPLSLIELIQHNLAEKLNSVAATPYLWLLVRISHLALAPDSKFPPLKSISSSSYLLSYISRKSLENDIENKDDDSEA